MQSKSANCAVAAAIGGALLCSLAVAAMEVKERTEASQTQPANAPAAPTLRVVFNVKQMHLSWSAARDAVYYRILQSSDVTSGFDLVAGNVTGTSYEHDIAAHRSPLAAQRFFLEACNAAGCTASNEVRSIRAVLLAIGPLLEFSSGAYDSLALSVAISDDGNTLALGVPGDSSGATGVGGHQGASPDAAGSGAVHVFARQRGAWTRQAYVKASNTSAGDAFGSSVSLSGDGNTLAVGAYLEDSPGTGVNGSQGHIADNNSNAGAAYVFIRSSDIWSQQAYLKAAKPHANAYFGHAVSLNDDGDTLAVGAIGENAVRLSAGTVYVFTRNENTWSQQAAVRPASMGTNSHFGSSVALDSKGDLLTVKTQSEATGTAGIDDNECERTGRSADAVYVFARSAGAWLQRACLARSESAATDTQISPPIGPRSPEMAVTATVVPSP